MKTKVLEQILTGVRPSFLEIDYRSIISKKKNQDHQIMGHISLVDFISSNVSENVTVIAPLKCFFTPYIMSRRVISWLYINQ